VLRTHPERARAVVGASIALGALGTALLVLAGPAILALAGAALVGFAAGVPFAAVFTGAAVARPDAPAAAVGFVNGLANAAILVGTPLVGLTFALDGEGRLGFVVVAVLWTAALLVLPSRSALGASAV
jgi:predicted MFS family arabinose efflux permease